MIVADVTDGGSPLSLRLFFWEETIVATAEQVAARKKKKSDYDRAYRQANRERVRANKKAYYEANREHDLAKSKEWRENNRERSKENAKRHYAKHGEKIRERSKEWYEANKEQALEYGRAKKASDKDRYKNYDLMRNYGITLDDYQQILGGQGGTCAICGEPPKKNRRMSVDHCHETGEVRGLLCDHCNRGLGHFRDQTILLQNAISYLRTHQNERNRTWEAAA